jgi:hypothetical protein
VIDDIQSQIQGDEFNARIKALLFWFLEMANHSLIKVMLLTSDRRIISVLENSTLLILTVLACLTVGQCLDSHSDAMLFRSRTCSQTKCKKN